MSVSTPRSPTQNQPDDHSDIEDEYAFHYFYFAAHGINSLNGLSYKEVQKKAKLFDIPRNISKNLIIKLIRLKVEGRIDEAESILGKIKEDRETRKKMRIQLKHFNAKQKAVKSEKKFAGRMKIPATAETLPADGASPDAHVAAAEPVEPCPSPPPPPFDHHYYYRGLDNTSMAKVFERKIENSKMRPPNITILKTETQSHYQAFVEGEGVTGYSSINSMTRYTPYTYNYYPDCPRPQLWGPSSVKTSTVTNGRGEAGPPRILMHHQLRKEPSFHVDPPKLVGQQLVQSGRGFGSDENFHPALHTSPLPTTDSATLQQPQTFLSNYQHPNYNTYNNNCISSSLSTNVVNVEQRTSFENLANTALTQHGGEKHQHVNSYRPLLGHEKNNLKGSGGETDAELNLNDFVTWNRFIENIIEEEFTSQKKLSTPNNEAGQETALCHRWEYSSGAQSTVWETEPESSCAMQSMQCPVPCCQMVFLLSNIKSHICDAHGWSVTTNSEASFPIVLGEAPRMYFGDRGMDGIKRMCFLQLADERLFVISVIVNFEMDQVTVFIQFVDDETESTSSAVLEVCQRDGVPQHWVGRVAPLSHSAVQLTARGRCLQFAMNRDQTTGSNNYMLHTSIKSRYDSG